MSPEEWHAKLDCLATDLLEVRREMENRRAPLDEIKAMDAAFGAILSAAQRNIPLLPPNHTKEIK